MAVGIVVEDLKVRSLDVDFNEVSWTVRTTFEDIFNYTFQVTRSEGPEGPFTPVTEEFEDHYLFLDNNIRFMHEERTYYYKLVVREKRTGESKEFGPTYRTPDADLIAIELRKHMNLLFREFIGRRCWVFPARTFGSRCRECWDPSLQKRTKSQCLTCYDTGFTGGYLRPIEAWVSIDPYPKSEQNTNVGPLQQRDTTGRVGYWPPLKPRDVIVEAENQRWRVVNVSTTQQLRAPVHQEISLHKIPTSDIEYKIPLDLGVALKDLWLLPARNMSNPQNLEAFTNEEIPDVLGLYGYNYPKVT